MGFHDNMGGRKPRGALSLLAGWPRLDGTEVRAFIDALKKV